MSDDIADAETGTVLDEINDAPESIADEWADEYPDGVQLFCARFDADDFKTTIYANAKFPDGTTIAIRAAEKPDEGYLMANRDRTPLQVAGDVMELHMCPRARRIYENLIPEARKEFFERWAGDTFEEDALVGKSNRSSRRAKNKKRR